MTQLFYSIAVLACPVGMGLMMWMMMRGMGHGSSSSAGAANADEVTLLRAEVDQLRANQRATSGSVPRSTDSAETH